jgi:transposase
MRFAQRRILAWREPIDMRCSFNGLIAATRRYMEADPLSGDIYLFFNRRGGLVKMLWWDRTGYCVFGKETGAGTLQIKAK